MNTAHYNTIGLGHINTIPEITEEIKKNISEKIHAILDFRDFGRISEIRMYTQIFLNNARRLKDSHGRSNPRVARSYIHTLLPRFKESTFYKTLTPEEQRFAVEEISKHIHKQN